MCNGDQYADMILQQGGPEALQQWKRLEQEMRALQQGAATFPAAALRSDVGTPFVSSCIASPHACLQRQGFTCLKKKSLIVPKSRHTICRQYACRLPLPHMP